MSSWSGARGALPSAPSVPARRSDRAGSSWKERQATGKTPMRLQAGRRQPGCGWQPKMERRVTRTGQAGRRPTGECRRGKHVAALDWGQIAWQAVQPSFASPVDDAASICAYCAPRFSTFGHCVAPLATQTPFPLSTGRPAPKPRSLVPSAHRSLSFSSGMSMTRQVKRLALACRCEPAPRRRASRTAPLNVMLWLGCSSRGMSTSPASKGGGSPRCWANAFPVARLPHGAGPVAVATATRAACPAALGCPVPMRVARVHQALARSPCRPEGPTTARRSPWYAFHQLVAMPSPPLSPPPVPAPGGATADLEAAAAALLLSMAA